MQDSNSTAGSFCGRLLPSKELDGIFSGGIEAPQIYRFFYRQPNFVSDERP
jgi:hypothetical protein